MFIGGIEEYLMCVIAGDSVSNHITAFRIIGDYARYTDDRSN